MAANFGKFIDRSPLICAAGMSSGTLDRKEEDNRYHYKREDSVGEVVKEEPVEREAKSTLEKIQTESYFVPSELIENISILDEQIEIQRVEGPTFEKESEEQVHLQDEDKMSSKDCVHSQDEDSVTALMHPPRTPYQVMWDSQVGHERYRTTHDDFNAAKDVKKGAALFEPEKCLKAAGKYNAKGIWVRCMCDWHKKEATDLSSGIEADYVDRYKSQIGKSRNPNHNIDSVPKGFAFGVSSHPLPTGMEELMKDSDCPPCVFRRDFYKWMASLNKCRNALRERDFDFKQFYKTLLDHDDKNTGLLPVDEVYDICAQEHITFHKEEVEALLKVLKIIVDDKIDYGRFIEIIDVNKPTIDVVPFDDIPKHNQYYETSSQAADYLITSYADLPAAGMTSTHAVFAEPNVAHTHSRGVGQESLESPLNFENKKIFRQESAASCLDGDHSLLPPAPTFMMTELNNERK